MNIKETIRKGMIELKINGIKEPSLKSRLLMQSILNKPRAYLLVHDDQILTLRQEVDYFKAIKKLKQGIPLQHITHMQEFMKMNFYVDENVLIPRPDTEVLVEEVIKIAKKINAKKILDLCTGSGAIAISIAKYIEQSNVTAVDISSKAMRIAKLNAKNNEVENRITFIESNLFENIQENNSDYYYLVINKITKQILIRGLKQLNCLKTNPSNYIQVNWDDEFRLEPANRTFNESFNYVSGILYKSLSKDIEGKNKVIDLFENM